MLRALMIGASIGAVAFATSKAGAATLSVPSQYSTIQAAVDAAAPGDTIRVNRGRYCGATLTKPVVLQGRGKPRIVGCDASPVVSAGLRAGFYLPGSKGQNPASGSSIRGFVFDGRGVSNANLSPLSFGVFARFASDVVVTQNRFEGTVQAVTNTGGDRWQITHNRVKSLTLLDCTGHCTGGDGIVIALARGNIAAAGGDSAPLNRPEDNVVVDNDIEGTSPDGFSTFSMAGILLLSADHTAVLSNRIALRDNPNADAVGQGILVTNTCCGLGVSFAPGSRFTTLAFNSLQRSESGIVVEGSGGANTLGLVLWRNRGSISVEGAEALALAARRVLAPTRAQPLL
jgi:nitrous oxidase accessory protein NosD